MRRHFQGEAPRGQVAHRSPNRSPMLLLLALATMPDVLDVGSAPGNYPQIQDAVSAAVDGDVIRVANGVYGSFAVRGKALTIVGASAARVEGVVRIQELAAGQTTTLQSLEIRVATGQDEARLIIGANQGAVRVEDVRVPVAYASNYWLFRPGVRVVDCADVTFSRCRMSPALAFDDLGDRTWGAEALNVLDASVSLFDCVASGIGEGGEPGIVAVSSTLDLFGSSAQGGYGGHSFLGGLTGNCFGVAGPGGDGVVAQDTRVTLVDADLQGGQGGRDDCTTWPFTYPDGVPLRLLGSSVQVDGPGGAPSLDAPDLVRELDTVTLDVATDPGDVALLLASLVPLRTPVPGAFGDLLVGAGPGYRRIALGQSGTFQSTLGAPALATGETLRLHLQLACLRPDPAAPAGRWTVLGATETVTVYDSVY